MRCPKCGKNSIDYLKSAEQGNHNAQDGIGWLYENGLGVETDYAKAMEWYLKSAEQGNHNAQYHIGWLYERGRGVDQDYEKAAEWYKKAFD